MTLKASFFQETTKKWRHSYLSVQNACIRITERPNKLTGSCDTDDSGPSIVDSRKVFFEAKIEECLVYYGLYEASTASVSTSGVESSNNHHQSQSILDLSTSSIGDLKSTSSSFIKKLFHSSTTQSSLLTNGSASSSAASISSNQIVNRENCLTFYHLVDKSIHSVCLESKTSALTRYACLFKLAHYPDTWSIMT